MHAMFLLITNRPPLIHELFWYVLFSPIFGYGCALMAGSHGRRRWVWFVLGAVGTVFATVALAYLISRDRQTQTGKPN
jgi:uncharacterized membrane protein YjjB (DUF3815 family)